ncbi:MAG: glycosyltransferase [Anaerolineae bacterium]|nr:glycosyltransferase [Anaerolineae bacterium]
MPANHYLPLVSLIIPTYNRCDWLRQAAASALAQTYPSLEIIVVDDGSTEDIGECLAEMADRVTVLRQENAGLAAARNRGIAAATGNFITFLDDDDLIAPGKIARQVAFLQKHPEISLVHCGYYRSNQAGEPVDKIVGFPDGDSYQQLVGGNFIWSGGPLLRRSCLETAGYFDLTLPTAEDWDLWLRLAQAGHLFAAIPTPLGSYRQSLDSMSTNMSRMAEGVERVLAKVWLAPSSKSVNAAAKQNAYTQMYLWLMARGYGAGQWAEGQRFLRQAVQQRPDWTAQPETMLPLLRGHALDARIFDPPRFVETLFTHLPQEADFLRPHHPWLLSYAHLGLALRHQAKGDGAAAQTGYAAALQAYPNLGHRPDQVGAFLTHYALSLPGEDPVGAAVASLAHLPLSRPTAQHILGDIYLGWAFQAYHAGQFLQVPRRVLAAWRHRPSLLKNRGAWAILLKSPGYKGGENGY